ncbi:MAG: hypothetical protein LBL55_03405 [Propionibacteriaceae bacterium]|jgi:hypothetical protein|nr:hypothetical protein [Propionibacteriaceae bacterium]
MAIDIEREIISFEESIRGVMRAVEACVSLLVDTEDDNLRYFLAERIPSLGTAALPKLLEIIRAPGNPIDVDYLAAWSALRLGDRGIAVDVLVREIRRGGKWSLPAANALGRNHDRLTGEQLREVAEAVGQQGRGKVMGSRGSGRDDGSDFNQ